MLQLAPVAAARPKRLVLAALVQEQRGLVARGERPGAGWHKHGFTVRRPWVLSGNRLRRTTVHQQRWREASTGRTVKDDPAGEVSWAHFELLVVLRSVWAWMSGRRGLQHFALPWLDECPSTRTIQRWLARLLPEALAWQVAIRNALSYRIAPSTLEEMFPAGLPPPGTVARWRRSSAEPTELHRGLTLLLESAPAASITPSALLVEAQRSLAETMRS